MRVTLPSRARRRGQRPTAALDLLGCAAIVAAVVCLVAALAAAVSGGAASAFEWRALVAFRYALMVAVVCLLAARVVDLASVLWPALPRRGRRGRRGAQGTGTDDAVNADRCAPQRS